MFTKSVIQYFVTQSTPQDMKSYNEQGYFTVKDVDGDFSGGRGV